MRDHSMRSWFKHPCGVTVAIPYTGSLHFTVAELTEALRIATEKPVFTGGLGSRFQLVNGKVKHCSASETGDDRWTDLPLAPAQNWHPDSLRAIANALES